MEKWITVVPVAVSPEGSMVHEAKDSDATGEEGQEKNPGILPVVKKIPRLHKGGILRSMG